MKFGYTIIYVTNVGASLAFFEKAFGLKTRFQHESGYGELETGETTLAFATHNLGLTNLPAGYVAADASPLPLGVEIALVTESVIQAHEHAIAAGAVSLKEPMVKPWGQMVSYLRCPDGTLVELCSPISA
ncbi:VOC family protein [Methylomonas sp. AM2-LC]|uniref:VOC family protein n=1 Tax=Methylomonas sp. AM2-LC TaxID=3153301 RepID=UPI0032651520